MTALNVRQRGVGIIEIALAITVSLGLVTGGVIALERGQERSRVKDLSNSATLFSSLATQAVAGGKAIPQGDVTDFLGTQAMPGLRKNRDGNVVHAWSGPVRMQYYGDYVFEFSLEGIEIERCASIATDVSLYVGAPTGFVYPLVGGEFMRKPVSFNASDMLRLCGAESNGVSVRSGWIFARSIEEIEARTGYTHYDPEGTGTTTSRPDDTEYTTADTGGTSGSGTAVGDPEATPTGGGGTSTGGSSGGEPERTYEFHPAWADRGVDAIVDLPVIRSANQTNNLVYTPTGSISEFKGFEDKQGQTFTVSGAPSSRIVDENGQRVKSGTLGTETRIFTSPENCDTVPVVYITFEDGTVVTWDNQGTPPCREGTTEP